MVEHLERETHAGIYSALLQTLSLSQAYEWCKKMALGLKRSQMDGVDEDHRPQGQENHTGIREEMLQQEQEGFSF